MGWRVRRSVKLMPGVRLNISNRGISTTIGGRGARVTFGRGRTTHTIGIPGTGVSYTSTTRHKTRPAAPIAWRRIRYLTGFLSLLIAIFFYFNGQARAGTSFLVLGLLTTLPHSISLPLLLSRKVFYWAANRKIEHDDAQAKERLIRERTIIARDADEHVWRPPPVKEVTRIALQMKERHDEEVVHRLDHGARTRAATEEATHLTVQQDKLRVLLFLARADGAVRGAERDAMVAYLKTQSGFEDANDTWLKSIHAKLPRDLDESALQAVARLGSAGEIDQALIFASEALTKLTKRISPAQLNVLTMLRHERARGPWRPARSQPHGDGE